MKRYIASLAALLMLGIYGCSGGGGTLTTDGYGSSQTEKASVTFKVDFAPGSSDVQSAALQSDITRVEIYYRAGCREVYSHMDDDGWEESYVWVDNCTKTGRAILTSKLDTATINDIPVGMAQFVAKIMKDNVTVVDEVIAQGKIIAGTNKIYLPVLRGTWQLDTPFSIRLVNNLANSGISGISDNLSFNISQIDAFQIFGRYERLDNTTVKNCEYYKIFNYPLTSVSLQFDNKTPFYLNSYYDFGYYYDNISRKYYDCGVPGINYTYNNNRYLFYNNTDFYYSYNSYYNYYNRLSEDGLNEFKGIDGWYNQVLQFSGGNTNANLVDIGFQFDVEKLLDNGSYFSQGSGISTLSKDPFLDTPDYKALTYYNYSNGKITGYLVEHAQTGTYKCAIVIYDWDNVTYREIEVKRYELNSCDVFPATTVSLKKSNTKITTSLVNKSLVKSINKSAFVSDGSIQNFSLTDSIDIFWGQYCYDNITKTALLNCYYNDNMSYICNQCNKQLITGQLLAEGTMTGKYRVVPFTATKQSTFNPAGYVAGAQIVDWIWKGAKPTVSIPQ